MKCTASFNTVYRLRYLCPSGLGIKRTVFGASSHRKDLQRFLHVTDRRATPRRTCSGRFTESEAAGPATGSLRCGRLGTTAGRPSTGAVAGIRVNAELNHQRHAQQGKCGQPGTQAEQQQQGEQVFGPHSRMRCNLDRNQRQLVLIPRQRVGAVRDRQPPSPSFKKAPAKS